MIAIKNLTLFVFFFNFFKLLNFLNKLTRLIIWSVLIIGFGFLQLICNSFCLIYCGAFYWALLNWFYIFFIRFCHHVHTFPNHERKNWFFLLNFISIFLTIQAFFFLFHLHFFMFSWLLKIIRGCLSGLFRIKDSLFSLKIQIIGIWYINIEILVVISYLELWIKFLIQLVEVYAEILFQKHVFKLHFYEIIYINKIYIKVV